MSLTLSCKQVEVSAVFLLFRYKIKPKIPLYCSSKGKVFPYSLPSVGPGADPGVQAVSPQVT